MRIRMLIKFLPLVLFVFCLFLLSDKPLYAAPITTSCSQTSPTKASYSIQFAAPSTGSPFTLILTPASYLITPTIQSTGMTCTTNSLGDISCESNGTSTANISFTIDSQKPSNITNLTVESRAEDVDGNIIDSGTCNIALGNTTTPPVQTTPPIPAPQNPGIDPRPRPPVACDKSVKDEEFHSLRPYQASACNASAQTALYCGNTVFLTDTFSVSRDGVSSPSDPGSSLTNRTCVDHPELGTVVCDYTLQRDKTFSIDLKDLELPIAGNTEDVRNTVNRSTDPKDESINDPQKINEYVSWYLNGVPNGTAYGHIENEEPTNGVNDTLFNKNINGLINFSGPLNKLLPLRIQQRERLAQVKNAVDSIAKNANGINQRHNQVVGCTRTIPIPVPVGAVVVRYNFTVHVPCYGTFLNAILFGPSTPHQLAEWDVAANQPPLEEEYQDKTFLEYWKAYKEWRGNICTTIPAGPIKVLLCINPGDTGNAFAAQIFPFIPLSSTEDTIGKIRVEEAPLPLEQQDPITITKESVSQAESPIYVPHMAEDYQLADTLQQTFVSKDLDLNAPADTTTTVGDEFCNVVEVKNNPGDNLFAGELNPRLSYESQFQCEYVLDPKDIKNGGSCYDATKNCHQVCEENPDPLLPPICHESCDSDAQCYPSGYQGCGGKPQLDCDSGYVCADSCSAPDVRACEFSTDHSIPVYTETPYLDDIWAKLVAGPSSVFKRIFPKIGTDGPLTEIVDAPSASSTTFSSTNLGTTVKAADTRSGASAELYFPHLGGIHEYFLECIQTALRPQGLGRECGDFNNPPELSLTATNVSKTKNLSHSPWLAFDDSDRAHIVFVDYGDKTPPSKIMYTTGSGKSFSTPFTLAENTLQDSNNRTGIGFGNGKLHVVYVLKNQGVFYREGTGASWSTQEKISGAKQAAEPNITVDTVGHSHIVYIEDTCGGGRFSAYYRLKRADGFLSTASAPMRDCTNQKFPQIAVTNNGKPHMVFGRADTSIIYSRLDGAAWVNKTISSGAQGPNARNATITTDGTNLYAAWDQDTNGGGKEAVFFSSSSDGGNTWSPPQLASIQGSPYAAFANVNYSKSANKVFITWSDKSQANNMEIWLRLYDVTTKTFSVPIRITNEDGDSKQAVVDTGSSKAGIVWQDFSSGEWQVYYTETSLAGTPTGGTGGGTTPGGGSNPPLGGQCVLTEAEIRRKITQDWGLPNPVADLTPQIRTGPGYWSAKSILAAERYVSNKPGFTVIQYLTGAWIWYEGASGYPNMYSLNCGNNPNGTKVSDFCTTTSFQIAGYQASKNYQDVYNKLYTGSSDQNFRELLRKVVDNSVPNGFKDPWRYKTPYNDLLIYLDDVLANGQINQLATSGQQLTTLPNSGSDLNGYIAARKRQLLTLIAGKDPNMVAALNSSAVSQGDLINRAFIPGGPKGCSTTPGYLYICGDDKQRIADYAYSLWKLDCSTP
jgi:hypothetical protein